MSKARRIRGYEKLTPSERFRLAVKAQARDDSTEFGRLQNACPQKQYMALDADYAEPMRVAQQITLAFAVDIADALGQLHAVSILARVTGEDWAEVVRQQRMRTALDLMAAFDYISLQFMGLSAETLLGAHCRPVLDRYQLLTHQCEYVGDADGAIGDELKVAWQEASLPF